MEAYTSFSTGLQELIDRHVARAASANVAQDVGRRAADAPMPSIFNPDANRSRRKRVRDGEVPRKRAARGGARDESGQGAALGTSHQRGRAQGRGRGRGRGKGQGQAPSTVEHGGSSSFPPPFVPPPPPTFDEAVLMHCSPGLPYTPTELWMKMLNAWPDFMDDVEMDDVGAAVARLVEDGKVRQANSGGYIAA
jgi:hypothetical protein